MGNAFFQLAILLWGQLGCMNGDDYSAVGSGHRGLWAGTIAGSARPMGSIREQRRNRLSGKSRIGDTQSHGQLDALPFFARHFGVSGTQSCPASVAVSGAQTRLNAVKFRKRERISPRATCVGKRSTPWQI